VKTIEDMMAPYIEVKAGSCAQGDGNVVAMLIMSIHGDDRPVVLAWMEPTDALPGAVVDLRAQFGPITQAAMLADAAMRHYPPETSAADIARGSVLQARAEGDMTVRDCLVGYLVREDGSIESAIYPYHLGDQGELVLDADPMVKAGDYQGSHGLVPDALAALVAS
jgi:hypothetical protein